MTESERIAELVFLYLRDELTEAQEKELNSWRQASARNEQLFREETDPENIRLAMKNMYTAKDNAWEKLVQKMPVLAEASTGRKSTAAAYAIAAVLFVALGSSLYWWFNRRMDLEKNSRSIQVQNADIPPGGNHATLQLSNGRVIVLDTARLGLLASVGHREVSKKDSGEIVYNSQAPIADNNNNIELTNTLQTPRGGQYAVTLADGTKVWLNASSSLKFPVSFSKEKRAVELTGEAYFEVAKNKTPFVVTINKSGIVQVLGTHFNIMCYADEPEIKTTLLEGSVKVTNDQDAKIMVPGEQSSFKKEGAIAIDKNADTQSVIAWKNGRTFFKNADIPAIMRMVSRWYDVDVDYQGAIPHRNITGGISRSANLSELLQILKTYHIHFNINRNKITITS